MQVPRQCYHSRPAGRARPTRMAKNSAENGWAAVAPGKLSLGRASATHKYGEESFTKMVKRDRRNLPEAGAHDNPKYDRNRSTYRRRSRVTQRSAVAGVKARNFNAD